MAVCWNVTGGSSAGEPGISAAGQAGSGSKIWRML